MPRPLSSDPKSEFIPVRMTVSEAAALDRAAGLANMSRSKFIRNCVRRVIEADAKKAARLRNGSV